MILKIENHRFGKIDVNTNKEDLKGMYTHAEFIRANIWQNGQLLLIDEKIRLSQRLGLH